MARVAVREKTMAHPGGTAGQVRLVELTDRDVELLLRRLSQEASSAQKKRR